MLKITKVSSIILIIYILFFLQVWGDNHLILYGSALLVVISMFAHCVYVGYINIGNIPFGVLNNLIMVIYALFAGLFVVNNYLSMLSSLITYAAFSIICIAICYVSSEEGSYDWIHITLIAVAVLCAVYTLLNGSVWEGYGKTLSKSNNPHAFAAVMYLGILSSAYLNGTYRMRKTGKYLALIFLFYYSIIACGSRKYLMASTCVITVLLIGYLKELWGSSTFNSKLFICIFVLLLFILCIYTYKHVYVHSQIYTRMHSSDDLGNQNRIRYYRIALKIFREHPLLGSGYDQFKHLSGFEGYSHSTYAEALADFGGIGCILYFSPIVYLVFVTVYKVYRNRCDYYSLLFLGLCISELFLGLGQIFFMEFTHFLVWTILFNSTRLESRSNVKSTIMNKSNRKYLRV